MATIYDLKPKYQALLRFAAAAQARASRRYDGPSSIHEPEPARSPAALCILRLVELEAAMAKLAEEEKAPIWE